jgi:hypothetical protein
MSYHAEWLVRWRRTPKGRKSNRFAQTLYRFQRLGDAEMVEALLEAEDKAPLWEIDVNAIKRQLKRGIYKDPKFTILRSIRLKRKLYRTNGITPVWTPDEIAYIERERSHGRRSYHKHRRTYLKLAKRFRQSPQGKSQKRFENLLSYAKQYNPALEKILIKAWRQTGKQRLVDLDECRRKAGMVRNPWSGRWVQPRKLIRRFK